MIAKPITEIEEFREAQIDGISALYTEDWIDRASVPEGLFVYDLRGSDDGDEPFATVEPRVFANFSGSVVTKQELPMTEGAYAEIEEFGYDEIMSLEEFLAMDN